MTFVGIAEDWTGGNEAEIANDPDVGEPILAGSEATSFRFGLTGNEAVVTNADVLTGFPFSVSAIFAAEQSRTNHRIIFDGENGNGHYVEMAIYGGSGPPTGAGRLRVAMYDGTATKTLFSSSVVDDEAVHHVCWTAANAADWRLYVDGVDVGEHLSGHGASSTVTFPTIESGWSIGNTPGAGYGDQGFGGDIAHLVTWDDRALTPQRVAAHATAALTAWADDSAAQRLAHLLDAIGWPTSERDIGAAASTVGIAGYSGLALDYALELGQTENGLCYMDGRGRIVFVGRHTLLSAARHTTSFAIFGDDLTGSSSATGFDENIGFDEADVPFDGEAGDTELPYVDVVPTFSNVNIRNRVQITRAGAGPIVAKDDASIAEYGMRSYSRSSLSPDAPDARNIAQWILDHYKDPALRFDKLTILPRRDPTHLWPHALGRDVGDRITVRRRPQGIGSAIEKDVLIEGISTTITPGSWVTTWDLTPAETLSYWILGVSELGVDTRLAY